MTDTVSQFVAYGIYHPLKGWYINTYRWGKKKPRLLQGKAQASAICNANPGSMIVVFDVIPVVSRLET